MAWKTISKDEFLGKYTANMKVKRAIEGKDDNGRFLIIVISDKSLPVLKYKARPNFSYECWKRLTLE
jgi:hypothetical protein